MDRRTFLATAGTSATVAVAGCGGSDGGGSGPDGGAGGATGTPADGTGAGDGSGGGGVPIEEHPAAAGLPDQPRLGPTGGHVVVAFEDPSCPTCARFHRRTMPAIRSNLVEPGEGAFVLRNYPIVRPWGEPATMALEATLDRDAAAHWALQSFFYEEQSRLDGDGVLGATATFLDEQTDVDGQAVASAVRAGEYRDAVDADLAAASEADLARRTPRVLLFRDGEYVTTAGNVGWDVIAGALGMG